MQIEFCLDTVDIQQGYFIIKYKLKETDIDFSFLTFPIPINNEGVCGDWKINVARQIRDIRAYKQQEEDRLNQCAQIDFSNMLTTFCVTEQEIIDFESQLNPVISETLNGNVSVTDIVEEIQI